MFAKRVVSAVLLLSIVAATVFLDWFFNCAILFFIACGLFEFFSMIEKKGVTPYTYFGILMGCIIPVSIMMRFELTARWELLFIVLTLLFLIIMLFKRSHNSGVVLDISTTVFGIIYVAWFFSFIIKVRYFPVGGMGLFIALLSMTKLGDIGAYLVGKQFGKRPLFPRISPKKTVEGAMGGLLFSVMGALACRQFLHTDFVQTVLVGLLIGVFAQLGDLAESLMKRDCEVKDSGKILPGMGGVLDVMDSLLFTAPVFYFYINL